MLGGAAGSHPRTTATIATAARRLIRRISCQAEILTLRGENQACAMCDDGGDRRPIVTPRAGTAKDSVCSTLAIPYLPGMTQVARSGLHSWRIQRRSVVSDFVSAEENAYGGAEQALLA